MHVRNAVSNYFGEAGWDVDGTVQRVTLIRPMQGVVLVEQGGTEESQTTKWKWNIGGWTKLTPTYEDVYQAFSNIGIEPDGSANYALPDNQITVYFGPEKENESEPTTLSGTIANLRRQRAAGLLPPRGKSRPPDDREGEKTEQITATYNDSRSGGYPGSFGWSFSKPVACW